MKDTKTIHSVDAPAGSGKTYQAIRYALTQARVHNRKVVMVFKSITLLKQAQRDAEVAQTSKRQKVPVTAIHSNNLEVVSSHHSVSAAITEHLNAANPKVGAILMITEAAFFNIAHWPNRGMWSCIFDEIPAVSPAHLLNIPDNLQLLTDHLKLGPNKEGYSQVLATKEGKATLLKYAENPTRDEINAVLSKLARHIISPHFETYVKTKAYERVYSGNGEPGARQINMFSLLQPSVFGSGETRVYQERAGANGTTTDAFAEIILMGAAFQNSLLGLIWPHLDLKIEPHNDIGEGLRYHRHDCGSRLQIQYLFETDWSKSFRRKSSTCNAAPQNNLDLLVDAVAKTFQGEDFVYLVNKDVADEAALKFDHVGGQKLPNAPWGLNTYQHIHNAGILSALNPTPAHVGFFTYMGLDGNAVREALYHSQVYQAIMRTSLRDPKSKQQVRVVLPDRKCAEAIANMFPGSSARKMYPNLVEAKATYSGRPKLKKTKPAAESQKEARQRNRLMDNEIKRIRAGGTVDQDLLETLRRECRSDNKKLILLKSLTVHSS
ncbi:hypothetical protein [Pelagimonas varians]|uniref:Uncharacterized protein n=1 Tax=Pelagimonas varians TaxID=696760 RepID=A0A238L5M2_9RHOB|nr:hypothetical protein [Pelagimonas varians]PYG25090.1 hypothetical protein C8N36_13512 [Pelagimonas varians]SMX50394.1 hypothetical protein PEV8663_04627 [Pelagimonas varians]